MLVEDTDVPNYEIIHLLLLAAASCSTLLLATVLSLFLYKNSHGLCEKTAVMTKLPSLNFNFHQIPSYLR